VTTPNLDEFVDPDMPTGLDPDDFDNEAMPDIVVEFSDQEAASKALEALPTGKYNVVIKKVELRASKSEKNFGKPMYNLTLQVTEGPYTKRTIYSLVMLWAGAAYSLNQLMTATGFTTQQGSVRVPKPNQLVGKELTIRGIKVAARTVKKDDGTETTYDERFEVKGYMPKKIGVASSSSDSLEP